MYQSINRGRVKQPTAETLYIVCIFVVDTIYLHNIILNIFIYYDKIYKYLKCAIESVCIMYEL